MKEETTGKVADLNGIGNLGAGIPGESLTNPLAKPGTAGSPPSGVSLNSQKLVDRVESPKNFMMRSPPQSPKIPPTVIRIGEEESAFKDLKVVAAESRLDSIVYAPVSPVHKVGQANCSMESDMISSKSGARGNGKLFGNKTFAKPSMH